MLTQFKISACQKRRSRRTLVGNRNWRGCVHDPWIIMHWKYAQSLMCGSYKLLYGQLHCDWAYYFWVCRSRGHRRLRPMGHGSTPALGTDRGQHCYPKNGHSAPSRPRIAHFLPASISISNRNRPRFSLLPLGSFNLVGGSLLGREFPRWNHWGGNFPRGNFPGVTWRFSSGICKCCLWWCSVTDKCFCDWKIKYVFALNLLVDDSSLWFPNSVIII